MNAAAHSVVFAVLMLLGGCQADRATPAPDIGDRASANAAANGDTAAFAPGPAGPDVMQRHACGADVTLDMLRDGNARMTLPDGRTVELARIAGSRPASFAGSGVYFTLGDDGGFLTQETGPTELACKPAHVSSEAASAQYAPARDARAQEAPGQEAM